MASQRLLNENTEEFLKENKVLDEWKDLFRQSKKLANAINDVVDEITEIHCTPARCNILHAFCFKPPKKVKVVIVGHEPIKDKDLATGLSFSYPKGAHRDVNVGNEERYKEAEAAKTVPIVHDALCGAGILKRGSTYDCCHEVWAVRGVLLLNACLIYEMWPCPQNSLKFVTEVLHEVARLSEAKPIFFVFWGTRAEEVSNKLIDILEEKVVCHQVITYNKGNPIENKNVKNEANLVLFIGHHPTYPRVENFFLEQATNQFKTINESHDGIFNLTAESKTTEETGVPETE